MVTDVMTTREAAEYLGFQVRTLETWRLQKRGPNYVKMDNRSVRYLKADLDKWLQAKLVSVGENNK